MLFANLTISKLRRASLLLLLGAPLSCGAAPDEGDSSAAASPVQAASTPTACAETTVVDHSVVIETPADAVAYRCARFIRGNLSVLSAPGTLYGDVDLSNLEAVYGDVMLAYAPRIDVPTSLRQIHLGSLRAIIREPAPGTVEAARPLGHAASANVAAPPPPPPRAPYVPGGRLVVSVDFGTIPDPVDFDAQNLAQVDADMTVVMKGGTYPVHATPVRLGLTGLKSLPGNLHLVLANSESFFDGNVTIGPFLSALLDVAGNVTVNVEGHTNEGGRPSMALRHVGGNFAMSATGNAAHDSSGSHLFSALTSVGGSVVLSGLTRHVESVATTPSLALIDCDPDSKGGILRARGDVGALRVENNHTLEAIESLDVRVTGNGPIVIRGNPALATCRVDAFIAKQRLLGWNGVATIAGNGTYPNLHCP
jgi:hypothetical protein